MKWELPKRASSHVSSMELFFRQYPIKKVVKGQIVLQQGDVPTRAYVIKTGIIKVCNLTSHGEEKTLSFKVDGDIFPVYWIFSKTKNALFYYQAHTNAELYVLEKSDILRELDKNPAFTRELLDKQINSYVNSELQVDALEQSRAYLKILYTFRHLALTHGKLVRKDRVRIMIPLTQQELADFIGLTRETTVGELSKLKKRKVIFPLRRYYSVDTSKLNDLIDDEYDPGITID